VLAREELREDDIPRAARTMQSARRLSRLFATLDRYSIRTGSLWAGIRELGGDRRFHWTCTTPCRLEFELLEAPRSFAVGLAAPAAVEVDARLEMRGTSTSAREAHLALGPDVERWIDLWIDDDAGAADHAGALVSLELATAAPERVLIGGAGPSPGAAAEVAEEARELAYRRAAFQRLRLRYSDPTARLYENPAALGEAYFASRLVRTASSDVEQCVRDHPGEPVACISDDEDIGAVARGAPVGDVRIVHDGEESLIVDATAALRYAPWSFRVGAAVSLVALLAWLAVVLRPARDGSFDAERTHDRDVPVREPARTVV
jgi:hypothetical protein